MRDSRPLFAVRTYALAVAVVLSPAFLQTPPCTRGNTELSSLELEVDGGPNLITGFDTGIRSYDVSTSGSTVTVRAQAVYGVNDVSWQWLVGTTTIGSGPIGTGSGEVTIPIPIPDGQSVLRVAVKSNEVGATASGYYAIHIDRVPTPYACTEAGIRQAIADGGGPHYFACDGTVPVTTASQISISNDVILDGEGNLTVDAGGTHGAFVVWSTVEFIGMTVTGGATSQGGGIRNEGTLTLTRCTISGNTGTAGAGINNTGELTLRSTTVSDNTDGGGILSNYAGTLTVIDSSISGNSGAVGGGITNSGGIATLTNSTISGNSATVQGGGGIYNYGGQLTLTNSTVSGNTAAVRGSGIDNAQGSGTASLTLINTTVFGNTGGDLGTAIGNFGQDANMTFLNSVIEGSCYIAEGVPLPVAAHTVESPGATCGLPAGQGNQMNVSRAALGLGALQDNGGATLTHAPSASSVTVDRVPMDACVDAAGTPLDEDQRGYPRPRSLRCDAGAVEGNCPYCDDFNDCTVDSCDWGTLTCIHTPVADDSPCALGVSTCSGGVCGSCTGVSCSSDGSECTADVCASETGACHPPLPDGMPCSTDNGECVAGVCEGGVAQISDEGEVTARPVVAVGTDGRAHVIWEQEHGSLRITYGAAHLLGSGWSDPFSYGTGGVNLQIVSAPNGQATAVWADMNGAVRGANFTDGFWLPAEFLNLSVVTSDPQVAIDWNGNTTAVWSMGYIYATQHSWISGWRPPGTVEDFRSPGSLPLVRMDARGHGLAVWLDDVGELQRSHYDPGVGYWLGPVRIGEPRTWISQVQLDVDPSGNAMVVWRDAGDIKGNYRFAGWWQGQTVIDDGPTLPDSPQVALDGIGNAIVIWKRALGIWAEEIRGYGTSQQPTERIDRGDVGHVYNPRLARDARGNAIAVWTMEYGGYDLWANVYLVGRGWDTAWKIHASATPINDPEVAIDSNGNAMVVWEQDQSIWAQYVSLGPPVWKFSCDEDGIRAAIAQRGGIHRFECDVPTTVTTDSEIAIDPHQHVALDGEGKLTIDGGSTHRVFSVGTQANVHLMRIAVTGGHTTEDGGGVLVSTDGFLTLTNSTVSNNSADGTGGGIHSDGGVVTVARSTISGNSAAGGGGIYNFENPASIAGGGRFYLESSTVSGNASTDGQWGGGILNIYGSLVIRNSTIVSNSADAGGGIATLDPLPGEPHSALNMAHSTVAWNPVTTEGSAIWNNANMYLRANVLQGGCVTTLAPTVSRNNFESPANTCMLNWSHEDRYNVTAGALNLGLLQDNGGPTLTVAPGFTSQLVDWYTDVTTIQSCGGADQRGVPRPQGGNSCDVGAFERVP